MAALMGLHQRVILHWCLTSLLFVLPGASSLTVEGLKGGNITLPCSLRNREDLSTVLTFGPIKAYGAGQDEHFRGRVNKSGSCDLILQDLKTTDAGKYISKVYANSGLISSNSYDVHVNVNLTGQKGEELMFELPREAEDVTHLTNAGCTEVWRRGRGVLTDQLTIKNFTSSDAGTYRVLNSTGGILVTVTVTEPSTGSKDKLDHKREDETHEQVPVWVWIAIGVVVLVVLMVLIVFAVNKICQHLNKKHNSYKGFPMQETVQGPRSTNNSSGCLVCLQCQQVCRGSCQHIIDQTQEQFLPSGNPSHEHLTLKVEHTTLL